MRFLSLLVILVVFIILAIVILFVVLIVFVIFVIFVVLIVFVSFVFFVFGTLMHHNFFSCIVIHQHNFIQMEFSFNNTESIRTDSPELSDDFHIIKAQIPVPVAETSLQAVERNKAVMSLSGFKIPGGQCASGIPITLKAYIQIHRTGQV